MKKQYLQPQMFIEELNTSDTVTASGLHYGELDQEYINKLAREEFDNFFNFW